MSLQGSLTRGAKRLRVVPPGPDDDPFEDVGRLDFDPKASVPTPANQAGVLYWDDGTNRCDPIGDAGLRAYGGSAWKDIPNATCGSGSGATSLVMTDGTNDFGMSAGTSYKWYQIGPLLFFKAYVQWANKGSASGAISIQAALPGNTVASPPAYQGGSIAGYTGVTFTNADDQPAWRVNAGAADIVFLVVDPNNGTAMQLMQDTHFAAAGILQLSGFFFMEGSN